MKEEDKIAPNRRKTLWILAGFLIMVTALATVYLPGQLNVHSFPTIPVPTTDRVVLDNQFLKALDDAKSGDLKNARTRLEYILSLSTEYPGAGVALTNIRATLDAAAAEETSSRIISTLAPVQEIVPRSMMAVTAPQLTTNTPASPQISTQEELITSRVTATPQNFDLQNDDEITEFVRKSHPGMCPAINLVENPEPDFMPPPPAVTVSEVAAFPDTRSFDVSEMADNSDGTLRAVIACEGERCVDNIYVKNQKTGKVYIVNFGAEQGRPLQWLVWLNRDTFLIIQSLSPHTGLVAAIDFTQRKFVHYGMGFECMTDQTEAP
ncbi:hypothetical protein hrd7_03400 [Leptolinea sp. HRD-7]|nr:hypothetical protein hrd7_03400 [Leptolinea sp. HRD-7]